MFVMVMIINVVMLVMVIMVIRTDKKTRKTRTNRTERGQIDLTFKLDFPGNLCRASFANFAMFYTGHGMDYSLNLGRERAA